MDICRGCGRPAFANTPLGRYCGRDECFKVLFRVCDGTKFVDMIENHGYGARSITTYSNRNLPILQRISDHISDSRALGDMAEIHRVMSEALGRQKDDPHFVNPYLDDEEEYGMTLEH